MYTINEKNFNIMGNGINELLNEIQLYLSKNQLILTTINGTPLKEEEIINIILSNTSYNFYATSVSEIENGFIHEMVEYVLKVQDVFTQLSESNDNELIINSFIEIINSLIEIENTGNYFNINIIDIKLINEISNKALAKIEKGDMDYLLDVIEFQIIPLLSEFQEKLLERHFQ